MNTATQSPSHPLAGYYRWHSCIYDITRWAFLFGRHRLILLASQKIQPRRILEIGCGTGKNLVALAHAFPQAEIVGLDLSSDMLEKSRPKLKAFGSRITLLHQAYVAPVSTVEKFDLIVLSYSLSMMNPGFEEVLNICKSDLSPAGRIAVVDFHDSRWSWFRQWMLVNHVRMEAHLLPLLERDYQSDTCQITPAYAGLWRYLLFTGRLKPQEY